MKKLIILLILSTPLLANDNEIWINQVGSTGAASIDLEQLGTGNIIGGAGSTAGDLTAFQFTSNIATLDINQIGDSNKWLGKIIGDSFVGFYEFDGDSNTFNTSVDPTNTYNADSSNINVDVTGNSNQFTLNQANAAQASNLDLDWIINGSSNSITAAIDIDLATNYVDFDGSDNTLTYDGDGASNGFFHLEHDGSDRTFSIEQQSTLNNDWLKIISSGTGTSSICVVQSDGGTSTSC